MVSDSYSKTSTFNKCFQKHFRYSDISHSCCVVLCVPRRAAVIFHSAVPIVWRRHIVVYFRVVSKSSYGSLKTSSPRYQAHWTRFLIHVNIHVRPDIATDVNLITPHRCVASRASRQHLIGITNIRYIKQLLWQHGHHSLGSRDEFRGVNVKWMYVAWIEMKAMMIP